MASTITLCELSLMETKPDDVIKLLTINLTTKREIQHALREKFLERTLFLKRIRSLKELCWCVDIPVEGEGAPCINLRF
jgi:hypothetical protein